MNENSLKTCPMGHYYDPSMNACPYCPKQDDNVNSDATRTVSDNAYTNSTHDKTQVYITDSENKGNDSMGEKTVIVSNSAKGSSASRPIRKLVGWLVTYTNSPSGVDYKIYEGRNVIGSGGSNDIVISNDSTISSKHLTILYRAGEFLFEDELSTNGSFINGKMENKGILNDGDIIRIADTEFSFRTAFKK